MAAAEERHARYWQAKLRELGVSVSPAEQHRAALTIRLVSWLGRRLGVRRVVPLLERIEAGERSRYDNDAAVSDAIALEERIHSELVGRLAPAWRSRAANSMRAAVFGVNDGLVSNLSLVMGMAGGQASTRLILLAGTAGMVAGAASMAAGEFISVKSERELLEASPIIGSEELPALIEGGPPTLDLLARTSSAGQGRANDKRSAGEGSALPDEVGSPRKAAAFSFVAFAFGAAVPLLPYLLVSGAVALPVAAVSAAVALFFVGAAISVLTHQPSGRAGLRQVAVGAAAALGTYVVGRAVGVGL